MQPITPIEIRQKSFDKRFRGYNPEEVRAFLHALSQVWEKVMVQLSGVEAALETSTKETQRLHGVENALLKTINDAEATAHNIIEQAQKEADLKVKEAEVEARNLVLAAQEAVKTMEEKSERAKQSRKEEMEHDLAKSRKLTQAAETYRETLLQKLQHVAEDILTRAALIKSNDTLPESTHDATEEA